MKLINWFLNVKKILFRIIVYQISKEFWPYRHKKDKKFVSNTSFYLLVPTCVEEVLACPSFNFGDTTSCCFTFTKPYPCINSPACHLYPEAPNSMCYRKAFQCIPSRHPWINKWRYHFYSSLDISYKRWEFHNNNKKKRWKF